MKKVVSILLIVLLLITSAISLTGCGDDDSCMACGGSGYYQKKDCPLC